MRTSTHRHPRFRAGLVAAALAGMTIGAGCSSGTDLAADGSRPAPRVTELRGGGKVVSSFLANYEPPQAPGNTMYLYRVEIPPGAVIAPHHHPGLQLAHVESGALSYSILEGTLLVGRNGSPTPTETIEAPASVTLRPGDMIVESESLVHHASNQGDEPVVIILASLLATGEDVSIPEEGEVD